MENATQQLKKEVRRLAQNYPLNDCCDFCGSTEKLERAHIVYSLRHPDLFITACKSCHEYCDIRDEKDTQILADNKRFRKEWKYVLNMKGSGLQFVQHNGYLTEKNEFDEMERNNTKALVREKILEVKYGHT